MIQIKDAFGNIKSLQTVGKGTDDNPFRMVNADYVSEVTIGNIPGRSFVFITGNNPNIGNTFTDINDIGGVDAFPVAAESVEILSDNVNDTALGTGSRTILVSTLDADFVEQTQFVTMDGVNPVALTGTHIRYRSILSFTSGGASNIGTITLRVAGGGTNRLRMLPDEGGSFSSLFTVPKGKSLITKSINIFVPKNEDITVRSRLRIGGIPNASFFSGGGVPLYQNSNLITVIAPAEFTEKSDFYFQAKSTNIGVNVTIVNEVELVTN